MIQKYLLSFVLLCTLSFGYAQSELPRVFKISENQAYFEKLKSTYNNTLLDVCNDDFDVVAANWLEFLKGIQEYSKEISYDLNGLRCLFFVCCAKDGTVDFIGYELREESINKPDEEIRAFLANVIGKKKINTLDNKRFSHYGGASFPLFIGY